MNSKSRELALAICVFLFFIAAILLRTDGVPGDEAGYWSYARFDLIGDFYQTGKPPLYFVINHFLFNQWGALFGLWQPLSLHFTYALFAALSLVFFCVRLPFSGLQRVLAGGLLLTSSAYFYVSTHTMMESYLLFLLALLTGLFSRPMNLLERFFASVIIILCFAMKETSVPALIALAIYFWRNNRGYYAVIGAGLIFGIIARKLPFLFIETQSIAFISPNQLLEWSHISRKLSELAAITWAYFFFAMPAFLLWPHSRHFRRTSAVLCLMIAACGGIYSVSMLTGSRYGFPCLWVMSLIAVYSANWSKKVVGWSVSALIAAQVLLIFDIYRPGPERMAWWPSVTHQEFMQAGATVMTGFPLFRLLLTQPVNPSVPICTFINEPGEMNYYVFRLMRGPFGGALQREKSISDLAKCQRRAVFIRTYNEIDPTWTAMCTSMGAEVYSDVQKITHFSIDGGHSADNPGYILNANCWL